MTWGLSWLLMLTMTLRQPAALDGAATYYGAPYIGRPMRNGEVYTGDDMTAAIDAHLWVLSPDELGCVSFAHRPCFANKRLLVCNNANCVVVRATDTGYLAQCGVDLDLSVRAYIALFGRLGGKQPVRAWVVG